MKIHEYQAKELFSRYDIPVPGGGVPGNGQEAAAAAEELGAYPVVVKAQIHAGGRGKGGGVKLAQSGEEASSLARELIGKRLITP
ncbi:MAG: succinate--CoA ligase subunit beta, partial [Desulfohalobiaceae bacterium]|nr:succinate--CoA ligase subunit beta [Desulfohalobiaceae bacterium]